MLPRLNSYLGARNALKLSWLSLTCRAISTELANALRPFYFAVHPDLFGQHPTQRNINEDSLKQLSAYMESLSQRQQYMHTESKTLQFYIRDGKTASRDSFKLIKITLDKNVKDPKIVVQRLLELCNLPTDYVKSIKSISPVTAASWSPSSSPFKAAQDYQYGTQFSGFEQQFYQDKEEHKKNLDEWIKVNAPLANSRTNELAGLKEEVSKLEQAVRVRLQLKDVRYDCGWNFEHYRGCLKTLERLTDMHEKEMKALKGRIVVFAPFTGVSLEGHVMLFTGDVLRSWIEFIKNIPTHDEFLKKVPLYENTLSQVLRKIKIGRRKFMPKQQARQYAAHLINVTTTLGDYLTCNKFPKSWPATLEEYEIVIESEAGPLMVSPTGQLIAPATCPGFMLIDFITGNLDVAKERTMKYQSQKNIEKQLTAQCILQLELKTLTKDDSVTPDKMIETLNKLLKYDAQCFKNLNLHITNYYSVLADGIVCIPWDFTPR